MGEGCSVTRSPSLAQFAVFIQAKITCPGVALPTAFLALLETFSQLSSSSQTTLAYIKLTNLSQHLHLLLFKAP